MAVTYAYPSNYTLRVIEQQYLPILTRDDPVFEMFPIRGLDTYLLRWRQWDNFKGMQQARGLDASPEKVDLPGLNEFEMVPGSYGEYTPLSEALALKAARPGVPGQMDLDPGEPLDINDWLMVAKPNLMAREIVRIKYTIWQLLLNGTFTVLEPKGNVVERDSYPIQTYSAGTAWSNLSSSTPLANMRAVKLLARGYSTRFDRTAKLFANQTTVNNLLQNANASDLSHVRTEYGATLNDLAANNRIFLANDLPELVPYDEGYYDETGTFQLFIPNGKAVLVGSRPNGALVGEYLMARNFVNPGLEGASYDRVVDQRQHGRVPGGIEYHRGHNGGPCIYYPSSVVSMNV